MTSGLCAGCGAAWKLPSDGMTYTCKECGESISTRAKPKAAKEAEFIDESQPVAPVSTVPGTHRTSARAQKTREASGSNGKMMLFGGIGIVVIGVILFMVLGGGDSASSPSNPAGVENNQVARPTSMQEAQTAFESVWNTDDLKGAKSLFKTSIRDKGMANMQRRMSDRGWFKDRPEILQIEETTDDRGRPSLVFSLPNGSVATSWMTETDQDTGTTVYAIRNMTWPELIIPDPAAELERFKNAFAAGNIELMLEFWPEGYAREDMAEALPDLYATFQKDGKPPEVVEYSAVAKKRSATLRIELADTAVEVKFSFRGGRWICKTRPAAVAK